jgi:hypothetical protein
MAGVILAQGKVKPSLLPRDFCPMDEYLIERFLQTIN